MNIWLKTESIRQNKLRESFTSSSVTSLRSPLPVILENQRNDEILSNSNISVSIRESNGENSQSELNFVGNNNGGRMNYGWNKNETGLKQKHSIRIQKQQKFHKKVPNNAVHSSHFPNRPPSHDNNNNVLNNYQNKRLALIRESTNTHNNISNRNKNKQNGSKNIRKTNLYSSQVIDNCSSSNESSNNMVRRWRQFSNSSVSHTNRDMKRSSKNKSSSSESIDVSRKNTTLNQKEFKANKKSNQNKVPNLHRSEVYSKAMEGSIFNFSDESNRNDNNYQSSQENSNNENITHIPSNININYSLKQAQSNEFTSYNNLFTNPIDFYSDEYNQQGEGEQNYDEEQEENIYYEDQQDIMVNVNCNKRQNDKKEYKNDKLENKSGYKRKESHVIGNRINQVQFKSNFNNGAMRDIRSIKYNVFSSSGDKNKGNDQNIGYNMPNNNISLFKSRELSSNDNREKVNQTSSRNSLSKHWKNSFNSFNSLHLYNNSSNNNPYQYSSVSNQNNESSHQINHHSKNVLESHHSHTYNTNNSKRLLTTNRKNDRREYIIALIQYCSNEVGMACYNITTGEIKLTQIIERMTYIQTISTLQRFYPQEIIFSNTLENTLLMKKLMGIFRRTAFRPVRRNLFDQTKGYYIYTLRGNKNEHNPDHKFLSYAALNALLLTMENTFQFTLTYSALNIKWHYLEEVLVIDSQTIADLEIFINKETKIIKNTFIDNFKCLTDGGMRMLRANILQPLTDTKTINERFDLVEILLRENNKGILDMLMKELMKFKNYEPITAKFIQNPKCDNIKSIKSYLNGILVLSRMCFELENLKKKVQSILDYQQNQVGNNGSQQNTNISFKNSTILKTLFKKLSDKKLEDIRKIIQQNFDPEILKNYENKNNIHNNPFKNKKADIKARQNLQKFKKDNFIFLFKIQKINDEFAEISRLTYSHTIEDIINMFEQVKQKCPAENNLKLLYNEYRGYYISAKSTQSQPLDLTRLSTLIEDDIIHINSKGNTITFLTSILISLNNRLKENQHKLIYESTELLLNVIKEIQKNMEILFEVNYWISMMDMIIAFVFFIKGYKSTYNVSFSRPKFSLPSTPQKSQIKISKLRTIWTMQKFHKLSNTISIELTESSLLIIHKQLNSFDQLNILYSMGFMTILSQIGCLVPAEEFCTNIYQVMVSKMDVQGNLQNKMSHFQAELLSLKNILDNVNERNNKIMKNGKCLILMDEILKGTQPEEEYALSMAAVQILSQIKSNGDLNDNSKAPQNIGIILISDRILFKMLGKFEKVSLCEFSDIMNQQGEDGKDQKQFDSKCIKIKESQLLQALRNYNFHPNFQKIYRSLPPIQK